MNRILLLLLVLLTTSAASSDESVSYSLHSTAVTWSDGQSCGASKRMMQDKHTIRYKNSLVYVNGIKWDIVDGTSLDDVTISFHGKSGNFTYLTIELVANNRSAVGQYTLFGLLPNRKPCSDRVELRGRRL